MHSAPLRTQGAHFGRLLSHWTVSLAQFWAEADTDLDLFRVAGMARREARESGIDSRHRPAVRSIGHACGDCCCPRIKHGKNPGLIWG